MGNRQRSSRRSGLGHWMAEVLILHGRASQAPTVKAVHSLRKALRRCRTMAGGLREVDAAPEWRAMLRASKLLFKSLGGLRDTHVLIEWTERLAPPEDPVGRNLLYRLNAREVGQVQEARTALTAFDRDHWAGWIDLLGARAARHPPGDPVFEEMAMLRFNEARVLHDHALATGEMVAWHDLRIGFKRLRYAVENFVPKLHRSWGAELSTVQECLGDVHDLDVLWEEIESARLLQQEGERESWWERVASIREERLATYAGLMVGNDSRWTPWERELMTPQRVSAAGIAAIAVWAERHGSVLEHGEVLAGVLESLLNHAPTPAVTRDRERRLANTAARLHGLVGAKSRAETWRMANEIPLPVGWPENDRQICLLAVAHAGRRRFRPGKTPAFAELAPAEQLSVQRIAAALGLLVALHERGADVARVRLSDLEGGGIAIGSPHRPGKAARRAARWLEETIGNEVRLST